MTESPSTEQPDASTIREAVRERYSGVAKTQLDRRASLLSGAARATPTLIPPGAKVAQDVIPLVDESVACDVGDEACCAPSETGESQLDAVKAFYQTTETSDLPSTVTDAALGCGNPTAIAELAEGETVLDLGSGGGIDCFLASKAVGPEGRVIGVDMTEEMLELARRNAVTVGAANVEFRQGQIEALPVEDNSVDVIISNCVINLSTDKPQVLREAFRVLKPGGRFRVSDIVLTRPLTVVEERYLAEWAGCIAGAMVQDEFEAELRSAGFEQIELLLKSEWRDAVHSADITARKAG